MTAAMVLRALLVILGAALVAILAAVFLSRLRIDWRAG